MRLGGGWLVGSAEGMRRLAVNIKTRWAAAAAAATKKTLHLLRGWFFPLTICTFNSLPLNEHSLRPSPRIHPHRCCLGKFLWSFLSFVRYKNGIIPTCVLKCDATSSRYVILFSLWHTAAKISCSVSSEQMELSTKNDSAKLRTWNEKWNRITYNWKLHFPLPTLARPRIISQIVNRVKSKCCLNNFLQPAGSLQDSNVCVPSNLLLSSRLLPTTMLLCYWKSIEIREMQLNHKMIATCGIHTDDSQS